jgi:thioredoxin 1
MEEEKAISLTDENFDSEVLGAETPVLVDFWAEWCGPCRMAGPVIEKIAGEYEGKVKVCKINVDEQRDAAVKAGVTSIPTLNIYKAGQIVDQMVGVPPTFESDLRQKIEAQL